MDLASIVKPGIFIVDDVALPPPIAFLVLPGEKAVVAKLAGGGRGLASGDPRVGRLSEKEPYSQTGSQKFARPLARVAQVVSPM
jgi:hypothetical protein